MGQSQKEASQAKLPKENQGYFKYTSGLAGLMTAVLGGGGAGRKRNLSPPRALAPDYFLTLPSIFLVLDKELSSFSMHHGLREGPRLV